MKTFKHITWKKHLHFQNAIHGEILLNGHRVSLISGFNTGGTWTTSTDVNDHKIFEVGIFTQDGKQFCTADFIRGSFGGVKPNMSRQSINRLMKKIQAS